MKPDKILLQTTIRYADDDWHVGRFRSVRRHLEGLANRDGSQRYAVTARNREPDATGDDPVLSGLGDSDFGQLWLFAVDLGDGLTPRDAAGIAAFRRRGGGVLTARDHQDLGLCLTCLGSIGEVNFFHSKHPEVDPARLQRDDTFAMQINYPNYHSGANGDFQAIDIVEPASDLLRTERSEDGLIRHFPAHPHEGAVGPGGVPHARVIATGTSRVTGRPFNLAVAIDGERDADGTPLGRVLAESTFHHFADYNWDLGLGCPSFVTDPPGDGIAQDPQRLEIFKDYVTNAAAWLSAERNGAS
jgi:hypothetical protein